MASNTGGALASNNPFRRKHVSAGDSPAHGSPLSLDTGLDRGIGPQQHQQTLLLQQQDRAGGTYGGSPSSASDYFRSQLYSEAAHAHPPQPPPSTTFQKPKPVKHVRVQSPPPLSPDSDSDPAFEYAPSTGTLGQGLGGGRPSGGFRGREGSTSSSDEMESKEGEDTVDGPGDDPFLNDDAGAAVESSFPSVEQWEKQGFVPATSEASSQAQQMPANPFQKTLQDFEGKPHKEGPSSPSSGSVAAGRGALDVNAFSRLLMTGQAGVTPASAGGNPSHQAADDASSVSRLSVFDAGHAATLETPRTSHEISETEEDRRGLASGGPLRPAQIRPKPPPPSSRHGKLIKTGAPQRAEIDGVPSTESAASSSISPSPPKAARTERKGSTESGVHNLPPSASTNANDLAGDVEAGAVQGVEVPGRIELNVDPDADIVPAPRPPTPPNTSHAPEPERRASIKKPTPPPRRQPHARGESKVQVAPAAHGDPLSSLVAEEPALVSRSSMDSNHSRSSSIKVNISAPAPPPPRRPNHTSRGSSTGLPPIATQPPLHASPEPLERRDTTPSTKLPPAPPPARNPSTKGRSASRDFNGGSTRRPPSISSLEASTPRRMSREYAGGSAAAPPPPPARKRGASRSSVEQPRPVAEVPESAANGILADLDALQREVDKAMRGSSRP